MKDWLELMRLSVIDPRRGAAEVMAAPFPEAAGPLLLALLAVLNGILYTLILPPGMVFSPIAMAVVAGVVIWLSAWLFARVGQFMGGQGDLPRLLRVVLFLQALRLIAQAALLVLGALVPPLAGMASLVAGVWGIYMMVCFLAEAHGFDNRLKALGTLGAVFVVVIVAASVLMSMVGGAALTDI